MGHYGLFEWNGKKKPRKSNAPSGCEDLRGLNFG